MRKNAVLLGNSESLHKSYKDRYNLKKPRYPVITFWELRDWSGDKIKKIIEFYKNNQHIQKSGKPFISLLMAGDIAARYILKRADTLIEARMGRRVVGYIGLYARTSYDMGIEINFLWPCVLKRMEGMSDKKTLWDRGISVYLFLAAIFAAEKYTNHDELVAVLETYGSDVNTKDEYNIWRKKYMKHVFEDIFEVKLKTYNEEWTQYEIKLDRKELIQSALTRRDEALNLGRTRARA